MSESIDISNNNGAGYPLSSVLKACPAITVVGIKAVEGLSFNDWTFAGFFAATALHGRIALPYAFARPENDHSVAGGVREADHLIAQYGALSTGPSSGVPCCDYETVRDVAFARGFLERIAARYKRRPLVYCSASRVAELAADSWIKAHADFWVADYGVSALPPLPVHVVMWQYTDHHVAVGGIPPTDASHVLVNPASLLLAAAPVPVLKVMHKGRVVITIKYGAGRVRRFLSGSRVLALLKRGEVIKRGKS